ncbi:MAG TPA: DUF4342 domain-containing protein [Bacteroidales bacterium]|nr:DUF4342 domain-containing protein [Bacteroidales bacterium]
MKEDHNTNREYFRVSGDELSSKIKEIIKEGNATRIIIKNDKEETVMEFPLTVGAVGVVVAPVFAAVGTIAALATHCTIIVEKKTTEKT